MAFTLVSTVSSSSVPSSDEMTYTNLLNGQGTAPEAVTVDGVFLSKSLDGLSLSKDFDEVFLSEDFDGAVRNDGFDKKS